MKKIFKTEKKFKFRNLQYTDSWTMSGPWTRPLPLRWIAQFWKRKMCCRILQNRKHLSDRYIKLKQKWFRQFWLYLEKCVRFLRYIACWNRSVYSIWSGFERVEMSIFEYKLISQPFFFYILLHTIRKIQKRTPFLFQFFYSEFLNGSTRISFNKKYIECDKRIPWIEVVNLDSYRKISIDWLSLVYSGSIS